jgi:AraC family transcriptional regulator of arabinose operon
MAVFPTPALPFDNIQIILEPIIFSSTNWRWSRPSPNCFNLWVPLEGQAELKTLGKTYLVQPGTAFVFAPHQEKSAKAVSNLPFRNFACRFAPPKGTGKALRDKVNQLMGVPTSDLLQIKELCRGAAQSTNYKDALSKQQAKGLCYQILAQVWRDAHTPVRGDPDTAILRIMDRLREQPSQRLSLENMAEETRLSVAQFNRRFLILSSGESPGYFAIRQRVNQAKHYLHGSSLQISEIADILGYSDIYFFSRQFKKVSGMSPSDYRRNSALRDEALFE